MKLTVLKGATALIGLAVFVGNLVAQQQKPPPPPPEASQFNFWLGDWEVTTPDGKKAGENNVIAVNGGRSLMENWSSGGGAFTGKSLNIYDGIEKKWKQFWVDSGGGLLELRGGIVDGSMVLTGTRQTRKGDEVMHKITWTPNEDGSVRQHWEQSTDGGSTWSTVFDGHYVKKDAKKE